jgi:site-specific recombinase XerD
MPVSGRKEVVMPLEDRFGRLAKLRWFRMLPLGPELDEFCAWLCGQGFSRNVVRRRLWQVSHFNRYLRRLGVRDCHKVERSLGDRFLHEHLPHCRCRGLSRSKQIGTARSICYFIDYLSERGFIAPASETSAPQETLLDEYLHYLKCERNLADSTIRARQRYLVPFLEELGDDATAERLCNVTPEQVQAFFERCAQDSAPATCRQIQGTLRTFFRFGVKQGYLKRDLTQAVPHIREYKLSNLPRGLSDEDAHKVLNSIDRTTPTGVRDFAIVQLLHTYGVRGGQLCVLRLQDIEWSRNRIRFPPLKGGKEVIEPLTNEVGEALLEYLRRGRPNTERDIVFLTTRAPFQPLRSSATITTIVAARMRRAGVTACPMGSHVFRHAFASRMLTHGQSLKTIADMLGHRHINTTFIYTKVDLETLRQLPLDWPEEVS